MITTFCICSLLLYIIKFNSDKLDVNFYELLKRGSILLYYRYSLLLISIVLSILTIVISFLQIISTNRLSKLSRQQVNGAEYNYKKSKNNTKDLNLQNIIPNVTNTLKEKIGSIVNHSIFPILQ
jgi:hypothetical protein